MGDFILAIVPTAPQTYAVHLVNTGTTNVARVTAHTGGFASSDDGLIEATGTLRDLGPLAPGTVIALGREDEGSFATIWWHLELDLAGGERRKLAFSMPKYFPMRAGGAVRGDVPVLGKVGWTFAPDG